MKTVSTIFIRLSVIILGLSVIPAHTSAQVVGGGGAQTYNNAPASNLNEDDFFSAFSIGAIIPEGLFSQEVNNPFRTNYLFKNLTLPFQGQNGLGATTGFNFGILGFGSLSKFQMGGNSTGRFGIQFGFDFGY